MSSGCLHKRRNKPGWLEDVEVKLSSWGSFVTSTGVERALSLEMPRPLNQTKMCSMRNAFLVWRGGWKMNSS